MLVNSLHSLDLTSRQLIHPAWKGGFRGIKTQLQATFIMAFSLK